MYVTATSIGASPPLSTLLSTCHHRFCHDVMLHRKGKGDTHRVDKSDRIAYAKMTSSIDKTAAAQEIKPALP